MQMRVCTKCQAELPATLEFFYAHPDGKFGLNNVCKPCQKAKSRASELARKGTEDYKRKQAEKARRMYAKHRETCNKRSQLWREKNPERVKHHKRLRAQREASGSYSAEQWQAKVAAYQGTCHWCKKPVQDGIVPDHIVPLSRGGLNIIENVVPSCRYCNQSKHKATPDEFLARRPDLRVLHP